MGEAMNDTIWIEIPQQWVQGLDWEQDATLEEIIQLGIRQLKIRRALALYRTGNVSLGYAAAKVGISKRDLICVARAQGIEPAYDEETVREECGACGARAATLGGDGRHKLDEERLCR